MGLNPHATELISLRPFMLTKWSFFADSITRIMPYVHQKLCVFGTNQLMKGISNS